MEAFQLTSTYLTNKKQEVKRVHPQIHELSTLLDLTFMYGHKSDAKDKFYELWKINVGEEDGSDICIDVEDLEVLTWKFPIEF